MNAALLEVFLVNPIRKTRQSAKHMSQYAWRNQTWSSYTCSTGYSWSMAIQWPNTTKRINNAYLPPSMLTTFTKVCVPCQQQHSSRHSTTAMSSPLYLVSLHHRSNNS
jgi:hypothetical protein